MDPLEVLVPVDLDHLVGPDRLVGLDRLGVHCRQEVHYPEVLDQVVHVFLVGLAVLSKGVVPSLRGMQPMDLYSMEKYMVQT